MKEFIKKHKFIIFLFIFSFFVRLVYIFIVKTPIISDFKTMYDASRELLNGTHSYRNTNYFLLWGYQTGHAFYQFLLLKIINSVVFLKIINCLVTSLIVVFIYLISKKFVSSKSASIISILYSVFPFPLFLNSVLTNQHLPLLLILISVYIILNTDFKNKNAFVKCIIVGLLLGLSNILRSEAIVIILSLLLFLIFVGKEYSYKKVCICFFLIVSAYLCVFKSTSYAFKNTGISTNGLNNMNTYWKFVCGLNYETNGMYSLKDAEKYSNNKELAKKETFNRVKRINKLPILFIKKAKILYINSDMSWSINHIKNNNTKTVINLINQIFIILFITLAILSINILFKSNKCYILCFITLFIYTGVYMFIEVMPRYAYNLQPFIAIIAAFGLDNIFKSIKKLKEE